MGSRRIRQAAQSQMQPRAKRVRVPKQHRKRTHSIALPEPERNQAGNENSASIRRRERAEEQLYRAAISEGMTRDQIRQLFGGSDSKMKSVARRVIAEDGQTFLSQSTAHRYYEYMLRQEQSVRDLDFLLDLYHSDVEAFNNIMSSWDGESGKPPARPSMQAAIMAIKAKSDIHDKVLKMGQEMGIIEKRAKEIRVSGKVNLAALPTTELKDKLEKKLDDYHKLTDKGSLPSTYVKMLKRANDEEESIKPRSDDSEHIMDAEFVEQTT